MTSENLNIDVTADTKKASKAIGDLADDAKGLEKLDPEIEVDADTKAASKALDAVDKQAHELTTSDFEITVQGKVDKVLGDLEKVASEAKETIAAAEALGRALGPELAAKADTVAIVQDLQKLGLTADEVKENADQLGAKLKEVADSDVGGKLGASLGTTRGKLDELGASADSSKSALANMIGNSAQDVGALGGVAGSTGVLIGQMAEYMADAKLQGEGFGSIVKNFAAVAGPAAALAAVISTVTGFMEKQAEQARVTAERNKELGSAMSDAADDAVGIADALKGNLDPLRDFDAGLALLGSSSKKTVNDLGRSIPLIGNIFMDTSRDVVDAMSDAGVSIYDFSKAVTGSEGDRFDFLLQLRTMASLGAISEDQFNAVAGALDDYRASAAKARQSQALFNVTAEDANAILGELVTKADPMAKFGDVWKTLMDDMADGSIDTEDAANSINFLADQLGLTRDEVIALAKARLDKNLEDSKAAAEDAADALQEWADKTAKAIERQRELALIMDGTDYGKAAIEGGITAMSQFTEQQFALKDIAADSEEAIDNFTKSIKDNKFNFDLNTEAGRANQKALEDVAKTMDTKLAAAYADSGGDMDTFKQKATTIATETLTRLQKELGLSDEQTRALGDSLGVADGDWEARFKLSGAAEAQAKLDLLNISLDDFDDPNARQAYMEAIVQGDYVLALQIAEQMALGNKSVTYNVYTRYHTSGDRGSVGLTPPEGAKGGTAGPLGMIAGEAGPEFARVPGQAPVLLTQPTLVPPGTRVTSARKTRAILKGRKPRKLATGTVPGALSVDVTTRPASGPTFVYEQNAPIYGVDDLRAEFNAWGRDVAQKISAGRRN